MVFSIVKKPQKTAQRAAIINYIQTNKSNHPTITDIYKAVSKKLTNISMTTIYNTMDLLKKEELIRELPAVSGAGARFEPNLTPHHHLICSVCTTFVDVDLRDFHHSMLLSEEQRHGFDVQKISINIYGVCPQCKNNIDSKPAQI